MKYHHGNEPQNVRHHEFLVDGEVEIGRESRAVNLPGR